jgi:hypothetical protein
MSMTLAERDWGDGYITDIAYLPGYFRQQSPPISILLAFRVALPESIQAQPSHSRIWSSVAAMGSRLTRSPPRTRIGE